LREIPHREELDHERKFVVRSTLMQNIEVALHTGSIFFHMKIKAEEALNMIGYITAYFPPVVTFLIRLFRLSLANFQGATSLTLALHLFAQQHPEHFKSSTFMNA
jgi:hypothetical protein